MTTRVCLDTSVVARWLLRQKRWQVVDQLVSSQGVSIVLPGPVITETLVVVRAAGNVSTVRQLVDALHGMGMRVEPPTEDDLVDAARLLGLSRGRQPLRSSGSRGTAPSTLSLGDALILAVTRRLGLPVVTGDRLWADLAAAGLLDVDVRLL